MTTIILVRHGENDWVNKRLSKLPIKAIYSSPITRCMETAAYISERHQLDVTELEAVGEVRYGEWEGKKIKKLAKQKMWHMVQFFPSRMRFPNGEALREVQFRAIQALEQLCQQHKDDEIIVVVSHADLIKLVLAHYLGIHIDLFQRIGLSPASVSVLHLAANGMVRVLRINDDGPLRPPPKQKAKKKKGRKQAKTPDNGSSPKGEPTIVHSKKEDV
jgi:probable phosphomutase (TIGR03848 family)